MSTIGESSFSKEWLIGSLKEKAPEQFNNVKEVKEVKEISGGKGFASKVYLCTLNSGQEVVLKVPESGKLDLPGSEEEQKENHDRILSVHDREVDFYDSFGSRDWIQLPKMFKTGKIGAEEGFLMMESFAGRAELGSLVEGFSKGQLLSMARDLARFQAKFLKIEDKKWRVDFHKNTTEFVVEAYHQLMSKLKEIDPEMFGTGIDRLLQLVTKDFVNWTCFTGHETVGLDPVMVHGNLWTNNIFWKVREDGSLSNEVVAYIDWQLSHSGCLTTDLCSVLTLCTEADVRRQYTDEILREYHSTLTKELGGQGPFSFEKIKELYNITFFAQVRFLAVAVVYHPVMVADLPKPVQEAQIAKFKLRAKFAIEDCLDLLDGLPEEYKKLLD